MLREDGRKRGVVRDREVAEEESAIAIQVEPGIVAGAELLDREPTVQSVAIAVPLDAISLLCDGEMRRVTYLARRDPIKARQAAGRGLAIIREAAVPERWPDARDNDILGRALFDTGRRARGLELVERSLAAFEGIDDPGMLADIRGWRKAHGQRRSRR